MIERPLIFGSIPSGGSMKWEQRVYSLVIYVVFSDITVNKCVEYVVKQSISFSQLGIILFSSAS